MSHPNPTPTSYSALMQQTYARRASTYDTSSGSYHIDLARDFVDLLNPQPGDKVLDLASGTGLIAMNVASRVGQSGKVVAVDWSPEMQAIGKAKVAAKSDTDVAKIDWVLADITSKTLLSQDPVRNVLETHGGFDMITICQGYMQIPDLQSAIQFWTTSLLRPGGRLISDMTTKDPTLQYLLTYHLPQALALDTKTDVKDSITLSSGRVHITSQKDFETLFTSAGLKIDQTVRTKLYGPEYWFEADEKTGMEVLEGEIERNLPWTPADEELKRAKEAWPKIWREAAMTRSDGTRGIEGRHPFYICTGRKPS